MNRNLTILVAAQALGFSAMPLLVFVGSLLGRELAGETYATAPMAVLVVGTALAASPLALAMQKFGRKAILITVNAVAALACLGISYSLVLESFFLYCLFIFLVGCCVAGLQQYRFAAMETVAPNKAAFAASMVLLGGIFAAFVGPEIALAAKKLTDVEYQGSFIALISVYMLSILLLCFYQPKPITQVSKTESHRPLAEIFSNRLLWLAIGSAAIAFMVMSFIMTATPISMHHHHGHSLEDTKQVIQSHIAFMFLPSLISPLLIRYFGIRGMVMIGVLAYSICIAVALLSTALMPYFVALILLGVGWNFLFVAGTSLLPQCYQEGEQYRVQAVNDVLVFSVQAIASIASGIVLNLLGWESLLWLCVPLLLVMLALLFASRKSLIAR